MSSLGERGLLGVAFDPNFAANKFVYVYYTAMTPTIHNRVSRFTAAGDVALAGSETILLDLETLSATNHNGGAIHFGPEGKLYVGVGENAVWSNAQILTNRLGKMLRINSDGTIPADNPFFTTASEANRAIWARKPDGTVIDFVSGISQPVDIHAAIDGSLFYVARGSSNTTGLLSRITYTVAAPRVDFTANGSEWPVFLSQTDSLRLNISFTAGSGGALNSGEIYIALSTPSGPFWVDPAQGLTSTLSRAHVGPLGDFSLSAWLTLGPGALSRGGYTWIILIDDDTDGTPMGDYSDFVVIVIN